MLFATIEAHAHHGAHMCNSCLALVMKLNQMSLIKNCSKCYIKSKPPNKINCNLKLGNGPLSLNTHA